MAAESEARLRTDARRNRDQIIAAAKVAFTEFGPDVPMEEIARRAGVGVGTLYRRFPDREALIRAVARDNFGAVVADARAVLAEEHSAWQALVRLLGRSRSLRLTIQLAVLSEGARAAVKDDPITQRYRDELMAMLEEIVRRAQREGSLRADVGAGDVAVLVSLLLRRVPVDSEVLAESMLDRALVLILDGLRADPGSPLPGRPVTTRDLTDQATRSP
ncbi:helix-turn-helix domain-containing protein [Micromonospora sp. NPDC049559]|uniref:TetR/AcrR family transcriptional regulator n=1 Tax=Micromonospora sp. NPDC049559 TaxID=3155923 RepID=UPI00343DA998